MKEQTKDLKLPPGIRNRNGILHWRFEAEGVEYSDSTDLRAIARNLSSAVSLREQAIQLVRQGRAADLKLKPKPFSSAVEDFLAWAQGEKPTQSTVDALASRFPRQREFFGDKTPLHTLTSGDVEDFKTWRRQNAIKEVSLANDINALSQLFNFGRKKHWCRLNPCDDVEKPSRLGARRMFILSPEDEKRYFAEAQKASQDLFDLGRLMMQQGCRPEEFIELEWSSVDLMTREIDIVKSKTVAGKRKLLMTPESHIIFARRWQARTEALASKEAQREAWAARSGNKAQGEILRRLRQQILDAGKFVFPAGKGAGHWKTYQRPHEKARKASGVPIVVYDLRHSFATRMANGDERNEWQPYAALPVLKGIMGHEKIETTMIYVKRSPEAMRMAMERYGDAAPNSSAHHVRPTSGLMHGKTGNDQ